MQINKFTGKILSIFFRIMIVFFGLSIVLYRENYYELYWYILAIIPYIFIYIITIFKDGFLSKIRLFNDYAFILFLLYGKGIDYTTICFLLLPIINAPNYTGKKKSILLYVLFIISLYTLNNYIFNWSFIYVTLVFVTINFIIDSRARFFNNVTNLNTEIESFFELELEIKKSYKVYEGIIKVLNKITFLMFYRPKFSNIVCFKIVENSIILENSSIFLWSHEIDHKEVFSLINDGDNQNLYSNIKVALNDEDASKNLILINQTKKSTYLFVFIIEDFSSSIFNVYYNNLLKSITQRLSRVFDLENYMIDENKKMLKEFREKYFHIQNAEKAMHFIRNRFNSLDNFIEMSKENLMGHMDSDGLKMYSKELAQLERNYNLLMDRVSIILNKPSKPFSSSQLELKSPIDLFGLVRDIWLDYFSSFEFDLNWNIISAHKYQVNINDDGLYILLTDWVTNLKKFSIGEEKVLFNESLDFFEVVFSNKYNKKDEKKVNELKDDFNSKNRDRILKRTSHGVLIMKSLIEEMTISGSIKLSEGKISLHLLFKKQTDENSNI